MVWHNPSIVNENDVIIKQIPISTLVYEWCLKVLLHLDSSRFNMPSVECCVPTLSQVLHGLIIIMMLHNQNHLDHSFSILWGHCQTSQHFLLHLQKCLISPWCHIEQLSWHMVTGSLDIWHPIQVKISFYYCWVVKRHTLKWFSSYCCLPLISFESIKKIIYWIYQYWVIW